MKIEHLSFQLHTSKPFYQELHDYLVNQMLSGYIQNGDRLPSIRQLAKDLHLSRTTIENAYELLVSEGYVISRSRSGYYCDLPYAVNKEQLIVQKTSKSASEDQILYNFSSRYVDASDFDTKLWRRYMRIVMDRDQDIASYGERLGEWELREALSDYLYRGRGVKCTADQLVIGAGIQPLLYMFCGRFVSQVLKVGFIHPGFRQAIQVFQDCHHEIRLFHSLDEVDFTQIDVLYLTPTELNLKMKRRLWLIEKLQRHHVFLIEDDLNGEMHYVTPSFPAIQGLSGEENVIYLNSFSRLLLPSLRIACMVLPVALAQQLQMQIKCYNQTASKIEQNVFNYYLREGHLERRIRKLRRQSLKKSQLMKEGIQNILNVDQFHFFETSQLFICPLDLPDDFYIRASQHQIAFASQDPKALHMAFGGVDATKIAEAFQLIKKLALRQV